MIEDGAWNVRNFCSITNVSYRASWPSGNHVRCALFQSASFHIFVCFLTLWNEAKQHRILQGMFELWGSGSSMAELLDSLRRSPARLTQRWRRPEVSYKFVIDRFGGTAPADEGMQLMAQLTAVLPFQVRHFSAFCFLLSCEQTR